MAAVIFVSFGVAQAQDRAQADVKISELNARLGTATNRPGTKPDRFICTVGVHSDADDDANGTELRILVPVGVKVSEANVISGSGKCKTSTPVGDGTHGFVACELGAIEPRGTRRVRVITAIPPSFAKKTCGALVWSRTPDPDPTNNHREDTVRVSPEL
jgi:hypothetical protein